LIPEIFPLMMLIWFRLSRRLSGNQMASRLVHSARTSHHGSMEEMKNASFHHHSYSDSEGDFSVLSEEVNFCILCYFWYFLILHTIEYWDP